MSEPMLQPLKRQLSGEGKNLLVRSISQDDELNNSKCTTRPSFQLREHPVLGNLLLVCRINSYCEYDNFIDRVRELATRALKCKGPEKTSLYLDTNNYLNEWKKALLHSKHTCKIGR